MARRSGRTVTMTRAPLALHSWIAVVPIPLRRGVTPRTSKCKQGTAHTRLATLQPAASVHENGFASLQPSPNEHVAPHSEVCFRQRCSLDHGEVFGYWQALRGRDAGKLDEESWRVSESDRHAMKCAPGRSRRRWRARRRGPPAQSSWTPWHQGLRLR
jgi:hypothetical protein